MYVKRSVGEKKGKFVNLKALPRIVTNFPTYSLDSFKPHARLIYECVSPIKVNE